VRRIKKEWLSLRIGKQRILNLSIIGDKDVVRPEHAVEMF
jgi:hypothetical protein